MISMSSGHFFLCVSFFSFRSTLIEKLARRRQDDPTRADLHRFDLAALNQLVDGVATKPTGLFTPGIHSPASRLNLRHIGYSAHHHSAITTAATSTHAISAELSRISAQIQGAKDRSLQTWRKSCSSAGR